MIKLDFLYDNCTICESSIQRKTDKFPNDNHIKFANRSYLYGVHDIKTSIIILYKLRPLFAPYSLDLANLNIRFHKRLSFSSYTSIPSSIR